MIKVKKNRQAIFILSLCVVSVISWFPILSVPFINDDFQILGFHLNKNFFTAFEPFWQKDISQYYWRPLGNMVHPFMLILFGFNALPFRILSLLLNVLCGVTLYKLLSKLGINNAVAMVIPFLFNLLPSHEFQYAWIADQGEILLAIFLMFSFYNYSYLVGEGEDKKYLVYSLLWFLAAVLVKETAYAGILIPWLGLLNDHKVGKEDLKKTIINTLYFAIIIIVLMLYRIVVIGSSPLGSSHFAALNPVKMILNFFIYFLLAFLPPETLELLQVNIKNLWLLIPILLISILLLFGFVRIIAKLSSAKKKVFFIGIAWFIIFILPALPVLMRWYVFTASIGLMISLSVIVESIIVKMKWQSILWIPVISVFIILGLLNYNKMNDWKTAGEKLNFALSEFSKEETQSSMFIWAVPDKYNRIPMMKLGVRETVQWALQRKDIEVFAPLRIELLGENPKIKILSSSANQLEFMATNGRFMREGSKSKYIITNESEKYEYEGNWYEINNYLKENILYSNVKVRLNNKQLTGFDQFYFDGEKFKRININI